MPLPPHPNPPPHRDTRSFRVQRFGLWLLVGLLMVVLWAVVFTVQSLQRQRLLEQSTQELSQFNRAIAEQTAGLFKSMETAFQVTDHWLQDFGGEDPVGNPRFLALVQRLRESSDGLFTLRVASTDGVVRPLAPPSGDAVAAGGRAHWRVSLPPVPDQLRIGEPQPDGPGGAWVLPVSWRLRQPVGGVSVLVAVVALEPLAQAYEPLRVQPGGTIALLRRDGTVLTRAPFARELLGRNVRQGAGFQPFAENLARATFTTDSASTDGQRRIGSFERLVSYPLTVVVTRREQDVLATFVERRNMVVLISALLSLAVLSLTAVVHRAQGALREAQERLERLALVDDLTAIMNRRAFIDQARREFARVQRNQRPCTVLVLDLDEFKRINDTHGHAAGDQVLRECAAAWRAVLRQQDLIGRLGGEEFCLVLPELGRTEAQHVAERLRRLTRELGFHGTGGDFRVTVSIGMATRDGSDTDWNQIYERADQALYQAKSGGRDRVVLA